MTKPFREFSANIGQPSTGVAGPDQIERDLDKVFTMFNPEGAHEDASAGGIGTENIQDNAITDAKIGTRTVNDGIAQASVTTANITTLLSHIAAKLKKLSGKAVWSDDPVTSVEALNTQVIDLQNLTSANETDIEQKFTSLTGAVNANETDIESKFSNLTTVVNNNENDIEAKYSTLNTKVDVNEVDIEGKVANLTQVVSDNETDIESKLSSLTSTVNSKASVSHIHQGSDLPNITVDSSAVTSISTPTGTLTYILNAIGKILKDIKGDSDWTTSPTQSLNSLKTLVDGKSDKTLEHSPYKIGTKLVDETNIADGKTPVYSSTLGKIEYRTVNGGTIAAADVYTRAEIDGKLSTPSYNSQVNTTAIANSLGSTVIKAPLNTLKVKGNTRVNLVTSSNMDKDSNADGIVDDFVKYQSPNITGSFALNDNAQNMSMTNSIAINDSMAIDQLIDNVNAGEALSVGIDIKATFTTGSASACLTLIWRNSAGGETGRTLVGDITTTTQRYLRVNIENIMPPANTAKITVSPTLTTKSTGAMNISVWFRNICFEKATTAGSYISSGAKDTGPVRVRTTGKNLFKNGNGEMGLLGWTAYNGASGLYFSNDAFYVTTSSNYQGFGGLGGPQSNFFSLNLKIGQQYTLSFKGDRIRGVVLCGYQDGSPTASGGAKTTLVFTPITSPTYIYFENATSGAGTSYIKEVQIEEGSSSTAYEPYLETVSYPVATSGYLRAAGSIADEYDIIGGKLTKNVSDWVTLDGSTISTMGTSYADFKRIIFPSIYNALPNNPLLAVKYTGVPMRLGNTHLYPDSASIDSIGNVVYISASNLDTGFSNSDVSINEWKAYFYGWRMANSDGTSPYLNSETKYTPSTWAEWNKPAGVVGDSTGIELTATNGTWVMPKLAGNFKPSTNYGIIYNVVSCNSNAFYIGSATDAFIDTPAPKVIGNNKITIMSKAAITNNNFDIYLSNLETTGVKIKVKDIRVFELPTGSQIEADFTNLSADSLAAKYGFYGLSVKYWKKLTDGTGLTSTLPTATYAGFTPYKMIYGLAAPTTIYTIPRVINAEPNGSLFVESYITDVGLYTSSKITIEKSSFPIKQLDFVNKINSHTGEFTPIDISKVTVASDGLTFTITGASNSEYYEYGYYYDSGLSTIPTTSYVAANNMKAAVDETVKTVAKLDTDMIRVKEITESVGNIPTLATVATTGSYTDLINKPTLSTVAGTGSYNDLSNKPTIPSTLAALTDDSTHRLTTDAEKTTWNGKAAGTHLHQPTDILGLEFMRMVDSATTPVLIGTKKADGLAWCNTCAYAATSTSSPVTIANVTLSFLRFGAYNMIARLRTATNTASGAPVTLTVYKNVGGTFTSVATMTITGDKFAAAGSYQNFFLPFEYGGAKATNNELKFEVTAGTSAVSHEVAIDSILVLPSVVGTYSGF